MENRHPIETLVAIIKSTVSQEVVLVFNTATQDVRLTGLTPGKIQEMQVLLQMRFVNIHPSRTLIIYGVQEKYLREYASDRRKYFFDNFPDAKYRLREEELTGSDGEV